MVVAMTGLTSLLSKLTTRIAEFALFHSAIKPKELRGRTQKKKLFFWPDG